MTLATAFYLLFTLTTLWVANSFTKSGDPEEGLTLGLASIVSFLLATGVIS